MSHVFVEAFVVDACSLHTPFLPPLLRGWEAQEKDAQGPQVVRAPG